MRSVGFDPAMPGSIDAATWSRWEARAVAATIEMRAWFDSRATLPGEHVRRSAAGLQSVDLGRLKDLIIEKVFRGRCAFCEVDETVNSFGDAEHYRPKRPVEALDAVGKMKPIKVGAEEHPGYGWLAYDWRNLVPACSKCNTYKANQFPVAGVHCIAPTAKKSESTEELNTFERPLLLHPYFDSRRAPNVRCARDCVGQGRQSPRSRDDRSVSARPRGAARSEGPRADQRVARSRSPRQRRSYALRRGAGVRGPVCRGRQAVQCRGSRLRLREARGAPRTTQGQPAERREGARDEARLIDARPLVCPRHRRDSRRGRGPEADREREH